MVLPVVYFIIMTSIVVHGITIPIFMLFQRVLGFDPSKLFSTGPASVDGTSLREVPAAPLPIHVSGSAVTIEGTPAKDDDHLRVAKAGSVSQSYMSHGSESTHVQGHIPGWGRASIISGRSTPDLGRHGNASHVV
jgi:hypothetical protein